MTSQLVFKLIIIFLCILPSKDVFSLEETFCLIDGVTGEVICEYGPSIEKQMSPCSTFKIPLSLMGYDAMILNDEANPVWHFQEGYDDWLVFWRESQTPTSWMMYSCVWYSQVLSKELGLSNIQNYLNSFQYGNHDSLCELMDIVHTDTFWINSSLKISPKEQADFIQKMVNYQYPVSRRAVQMTKAILFKEELSQGWKLFGKTGWSGSDITKDGKTLEHGWFVGWIEKNNSFYPFAYLISDKKINLDQRIPRVKQLLINSNIMLEIVNE
ncbi:MAG: class D beta-lactamase [Chlamydiae bacterium]|nr:class D beta-lactamase [Chlamydiota bacterium]